MNWLYSFRMRYSSWILCIAYPAFRKCFRARDTLGVRRVAWATTIAQPEANVAIMARDKIVIVMVGTPECACMIADAMHHASSVPNVTV